MKTFCAFICTASVVLAVPSSVQEVGATAETHLSTAGAIGLGFAILGISWAGARLVVKYMRQ